MNTKIISWNVNGLADSNKRDDLRVLIRLWKPLIICIQETHMAGLQRHQVKQIWGAKNFDWVALDSLGQSGGILMIWNNNKVVMIESLLGAFSISIRCKYINDDFVWLLTSVYGPVLNFEKDQFWEELGDIRYLWNDPWVLSGDFNITRFASERSGTQSIASFMRKFSNLVHDHQLLDLPLVGSHFTWSINSSWSKLDRFLISSEWEDHFLRIEQSTLPKPFSDHIPIVLSTEEEEGWGPTPCRFENNVASR
ncbi:uncharacterized protein LOC113359979 [Papaver somniferum]|uniref:uncharacterized protein LOC113359979 n=1 Tax=Papaver somniferum TaxID=3469 RepID=UPI000E6FC67A|nr:uncharacterized protein LOC113359979 [Papaver somniferum]